MAAEITLSGNILSQSTQPEDPSFGFQKILVTKIPLTSGRQTSGRLTSVRLTSQITIHVIILFEALLSERPVKPRALLHKVFCSQETHSHTHTYIHTYMCVCVCVCVCVFKTTDTDFVFNCLFSFFWANYRSQLWLEVV